MTEGPEQSPAIPTVAYPSRPTWITPLTVIICVGVFIGLLMQGDYESEEALARFGLLSADRIWDGAYWGLFTPAFIHFEIWHICTSRCKGYIFSRADRLHFFVCFCPIAFLF